MSRRRRWAVATAGTRRVALIAAAIDQSQHRNDHEQFSKLGGTLGVTDWGRTTIGCRSGIGSVARVAAIVIFGATGYTGELTARALVARGVRPVLAARSPERLCALAGALGNLATGDLDTAVADVDRPDSVRALVGAGDVLVSTVGPFLRYGGPAVRAAVDAGAHYLDSTGEGPFIRSVFEQHGPEAARAGCALLTAFGFDWVPGNLAGALALREAGPRARRIDIGYFVTGSPSGGTRASAAGMLLEPAFGWRSHQLVREPTGRRTHSFDVDGQRFSGLSVGGSEHLALPRQYPDLTDVGVYVGHRPSPTPHAGAHRPAVSGAATRALQAGSVVLNTAARLPSVRGTLQVAARRLLPGSTGGPDADSRARTHSTVVAVATDADGHHLAQARLEGINAYDFTANILAWAAQRIAAGGLSECGALGPVDGFDLDALEEGVAEAGLRRV